MENKDKISIVIGFGWSRLRFILVSSENSEILELKDIHVKN